MAYTPDEVVLIQEFKGQHSNASPHAIEKGKSRLQINAGTVSEGRLDVREGLSVVTYDN